MYCKDLRNNGHTKSAVYDIYPSGASSRPVKVYCDMETMDGGWTAIQKRVNGSESFDRNWTEYKNGFGTPEQDIWIGNDLIHRLTEKKKSSLLVSITLVNGTRLFELYDQFSVSDEAEKYKIFLAGNATGTLGDSMLNTGLNGKNLSGMYFSTPKTDNDKSGGFCAGSVGARGGWWFNDCHYAFLNGNWASVMWTLPWYPTITSALSIKETMMMIKRH
ncbi:ficolin-1-like [Saccostrea echinata]|uniref:ficolin-1-like n=1 Tax=Saccostrea echinata TaxID=191078 RepID=UPI002A80DF32|nr:ficolin-1-like [Saccostrea echinata]